jgi:ABC-type sugar transport system permease subunit
VSTRLSAPVAGGSLPGGRRGSRRPRLRGLPGWLFAAPSLIIILVFIVYPITQSLWYSLHDWRIGATDQVWLGLGNYERLLGDALFWNALRVTLVFSVVSVILQIAIGYWAANALVKDTWFNKVVRSIFFFPTIVALATIGLVWRFLLDSRIGFIGGIPFSGGEPVDFLQDPALALPTVIFVSVWKTVGYAMVILLAGIKGVPESLYEAARVDGANPRQLNWHVTLPSIRPTLLFVTMILTINSLQVFDLVYVMTNGGPLFATDTLVTMMFREGFTNFNLGYASAIAWVLFVIIMLLSALQLRLFRYQDVD